MHRTPIRRITLLVLCAVPLAVAAQESLQLKPQRSLLSRPASRQESGPVFIEADKVEGRSENEVEAEGGVKMRRLKQSINADWLRYNATDQELEAAGHIRLEYEGAVLEGTRLRLNLGTERGFLDEPAFKFTPVPRAPPPPPGTPGYLPLATTGRRGIPTMPTSEPLESRGGADRLLFQGPDFYRIEQASYTTCGPGNDDWFIRARELDIDKNRDLGVARGASIVFLDHTMFYTPYISFPLHQQRKSGFLAPHYGSSTTTGAEITMPYYWNIAPNRDATFYPRMMSKRGLQLGSEFRYLDNDYNGEARIEYLPDRQLNQDRYGYFFKHAQAFPNGWTGAFNVNRVSDDRYFTDLSTLVAVTSRVTLPNEAVLARTGAWGDGTYAFSALGQQWQTLQTDPLAPLTPPYNRMPQVTFTAFPSGRPEQRSRRAFRATSISSTRRS